MISGVHAKGVKQMLEYIHGLPDQLEYCLQQEYRITIAGGISNVVVAGMGGSAIGGDVLRCCLSTRKSVPVLVSRDYRLPGFVGRDSLVLAVSYSGNTEETISAFENARAKGARIIAVTTGGHLGSLAEKAGIPLITIPAGLPPRAALGYLFTPLALMAEMAGLADGIRDEIRETAAVLKEIREELCADDPDGSNSAFELALELKDCIPVIWAAGSDLEVAAMRWKGQINENAKAPAYYNCFPELNHNEFTGLEGPEMLTKRIAVIILRGGNEHPRIGRRMDITREILNDRITKFLTVKARGRSRMAQLFSLIYTGDFVSTYLAAIYGVDPVPVNLIEALKKRLQDG